MVSTISYFAPFVPCVLRQGNNVNDMVGKLISIVMDFYSHTIKLNLRANEEGFND